MSALVTMGKVLVVSFVPPLFWFALASYFDASRWEAAAFAVGMWALALHFDLRQKVDRWLSKPSP